MVKTLLTFVICIILAGCNQTPEMAAFNVYKKQIPFLKLPYKCACYDNVTHLKLKMPDSTFKKYAPEGASGIIGLIKDTDFYSAILYSVAGDIEYPIIQTYDRNGVKLNDVGLINGSCCGYETNCTGYSWGAINRDLSIILVDSEKVFKTDAGGAAVAGATKLVNSKELYGITNNGYIRLKPNQNFSIQSGGVSLEKADLINTKKDSDRIKKLHGDTVAKSSNKIPSVDSTKVIYKVQIASSPVSISPGDTKFKDLPDVEMYIDKNTYKYTTGRFNSRDEAVKLQLQLRANRFKEAFVVAFKGRNRI